jgi:hypothetical protein
MSIDEIIPFDIVKVIACCHSAAWSGMLLVRRFLEFAMSEDGRALAWKTFGSVEFDLNGSLIYRINGKLHSFADQPAIIALTRCGIALYARRFGPKDEHIKKILRGEIFSPHIKKIWYRLGEIHRDDDLPAKEYTNGKKIWCQHGQIHRGGNMPAITGDDGYKGWWQYNKKHRDDDLPAEEYADGTKKWFHQGLMWRADNKPCKTLSDGSKFWYIFHDDVLKLHRDNDLPAVITPTGIIWCHRGQIHRMSGPATIKRDGTLVYRNSGMLHREDGPAVIYPDGKFQFWFRNILCDAKTLAEFKLFMNLISMKCVDEVISNNNQIYDIALDIIPADVLENMFRDGLAG